MKQHDRSRLRRIIVDILGVLAIIAAAITSPIPGPGGIPLLILGLSLLATNHEWAERLLLAVKKHGLNLGEKIFVDNTKVKLLLDALSVILIAAAVLLVTHATKSVFKTAAISLFFLALLVFFGNRNRSKHVKRLFKQKLKKQ